MRENRDLLKGIYSPSKIHVKIYGKVNNPGVYDMNHGDQVRQLVEKAGGTTSNFNHSNVILDTEVIDGQVIRIE